MATKFKNNKAVKAVIEKFKTNKFWSASVRLSLCYVLIVMTISICFSVVLYNLSAQEIDRGLGKQTRALRDISAEYFMQNGMPDFEKLRSDQAEESNNRLQINLIYFNLAILILSSIASYFLARKTLEPIEEAMESQNRFTADASHELRTPLTAMKTEIEVALRDRELKLSEAKDLLKSNLEEIEKLRSLSDALLRLARSDTSSQKDLEFSDVNLAEIITAAYEKVTVLAEKKSISFKNNLVELKVPGDKQSLTELFVILLDNAIKYSPEKSEIYIDINEEGGHAVIRVKDHGIGMKASEIPYIFNRFFRADCSRNCNVVSGYGLGLSIAKRIVDLHNGKILVNSKPGKGSEFTVII